MSVTGSVTAASRWVSAMLVLGLALAAAPVAAVTLGDLVVKSRPGEPLRANIPITLEAGEPIAELRVVAASQSAYAEQSLERPSLLEGMRIALLATGEQSGRIQLFGSTPWQGEEAQLLLQLNWPGGERTERYRIAPVVQSVEEKTPLYVEVGENESLAEVAIRLSRQSNRSYRHMMVALYRANPEAFYRDNLNNLKGDVTLRVPTQEELYRLSDGEVTRVLREHKARWQAAREEQQQLREKNERVTQQLEQVTRESSELEQRNQELKERLERLEREMSQMSRKVLDYPAEPNSDAAPPTASPPVTAEEVESGQGDEAQAPPRQTDENQAQNGDAGGISAGTMLLLMLLVGGVVFLLWRFAPRAGKGA